MSGLIAQYFQLIAFVLQNNYHYPPIRVYMISIIQFLMRISLLFPFQAWTQWKSNDDVIFQYIQNALKLFNAHSLLK